MAPPADDDTPLRRDAYEEKFGDRIDRIAKPGRPPAAAAARGSGWGKGIGAGVVAVLVLAVVKVALLGVSRSPSPMTFRVAPLTFAPIRTPADWQEEERRRHLLIEQDLKEMERQLREAERKRLQDAVDEALRKTRESRKDRPLPPATK